MQSPESGHSAGKKSVVFVTRWLWYGRFEAMVLQHPQLVLCWNVQGVPSVDFKRYISLSCTDTPHLWHKFCKVYTSQWVYVMVKGLFCNVVDAVQGRLMPHIPFGLGMTKLWQIFCGWIEFMQGMIYQDIGSGRSFHVIMNGQFTKRTLKRASLPSCPQST